MKSIRNRLDMSEPQDVATWDLLLEIQNTDTQTFINDFVKDLQALLAETEEQIKTFEQLRVYWIQNREKRKECVDVLTYLNKEKDGLRTTLRNKAYKRVGNTSGKGTIPARRAA